MVGARLAPRARANGAEIMGAPASERVGGRGGETPLI
jgi:hypothetical protein